MKPGINQWAFPDAMPAVEAISWAKRLGFQAFELCVGEQGPTPITLTEAEATAIRRHAEKEDIVLHSIASGMGWQVPMSSIDPAVRAKGIESNRKALQIGGWIGAKALLVVPGVVDAATSYDEALENALAGVQALLPDAERAAVAIAVENVWNKLLLSPTEMRDFIDQWESPWVGAYVDVGNIIPYGYPEHWIRILAHRIRAVHMKDFRAAVATLGGFVMLMEGDVNWPAVMEALGDVGFDGPLTAEYWTYSHSRETMLRHVITALNAIMTF